MKTIAIIPARMGSSRFPGKPLAKINGIPMIEHVYRRTCESKMLDEVYIATPDDEIETYCRTINAPCIMTSPKHERCTGRVAEALNVIEAKQTNSMIDIVVMVQGDEPMISGEHIDSCVIHMNNHAEVKVMNCVTRVLSDHEFNDRNEIKVVMDQHGNAMYFSREPIPSSAKYNQTYERYKQVCVIPFRRSFLDEFNQTNESPLERVESIDMLRILERNLAPIPTMVSAKQSYSVDTPDDLKRVEMLLNHKDKENHGVT